MTTKVYLAIVISILFINSSVPQTVPHSKSIVLSEDARLNLTGLASKYGLDCQVYDVTTEDGYILKLFHIPGNRSAPVFIMHGIIDSADSFLLRGKSSLAAVLHAEGYDVWLGNSRGSRYSRRHVKLNPDTDKAFWNFSFHELGYYDLPAMIDFILDQTGESTLSAMGHSQGNQIFYVLGSTRPEYNEKINVLIALGPICFLHNVIPPVNEIVALGPMIDQLLKIVGQEEVLGDNSLFRVFLDLFCLQSAQGYKMCVDGVLFPLAGPDRANFEPEFYKVALAHYPTGTSRNNALHLMQVARKRDFVQYDRGEAGNLAAYNSTIPPRYDLSKVTMKVALIAARNDRLSALRDVKILRSKLPNVVEYKVMDYPLFNHMDYTWGKNAKKMLYPHIIKILRSYGQAT